MSQRWERKKWLRIFVLCGSEVTEQTATIKLESLSAMNKMEFQSGMDLVSELNHQRQGEHGYHDDSKVKAVIRIPWLKKDLWCWLVDHGVPRREVRRNPLNSYLICLSGRVLAQVNRSLMWITKRVMIP